MFFSALRIGKGVVRTVAGAVEGDVEQLAGGVKDIGKGVIGIVAGEEVRETLGLGDDE